MFKFIRQHTLDLGPTLQSSYKKKGGALPAAYGCMWKSKPGGGFDRQSLQAQRPCAEKQPGYGVQQSSSLSRCVLLGILRLE